MHEFYRRSNIEMCNYANADDSNDANDVRQCERCERCQQMYHRLVSLIVRDGTTSILQATRYIGKARCKVCGSFMDDSKSRCNCRWHARLRPTSPPSWPISRNTAQWDEHATWGRQISDADCSGHSPPVKSKKCIEHYSFTKLGGKVTILQNISKSTIVCGFFKDKNR